MSEREKIQEIVNNLPDDKLIFVLTYLQGLEDGLSEDPNDETLAAFAETDAALNDGTIKPFTGSTKDFLDDILEG